MSTELRVQELEEQVRYHADLYYNESQPEIADSEYDAMVDELRKLAPDSPALVEVGAIPSYGRKVTHDRLMGSLDKETTVDAVVGWQKQYGKTKLVAITPKIDGTAGRLNYVNGKLVGGATRGNGVVGQDITDNIREMLSVPNSLGNDFSGEVRGEFYMKWSVFNKVNEELAAKGERQFANPRNAASGSVNQQDPKITKERNIDFFIYDVYCDDGTDFETEQEKRAYMALHLPGLEPVPMEVVPIDEFEQVSVKWEAQRQILDYMIDGLVSALNSIEAQEEAGMSGNRPRGKMAFKFKPEQKTAKVRNIDFQVGRTGRLTPMARIEPTLIAGSTVSNITLHNVANVKKMDIAIGDEVLIEKAGDIIPQVVKVIDRTGREQEYADPDVCPSCDKPVELDDGKVSLWCQNPACGAKLEERMMHWLNTLEVMGVGPAFVADVCGRGLVKDVADLYYLKPTDCGQAVAVLEKDEIPLWQFLAALGINGLGKTTSKILAKEYKSISAVMELTVMPWGEPEAHLIKHDGIGDVIAKNIVDGLKAMHDTIRRVCEVITVVEVQDATGPLVGKTFCMTGALPSGKKRNELAKEIEAAGGDVKSSVGKGLTYLVMADPESTSSKAVKARKLGTKIISEEQLMEMIG